MKVGIKRFYSKLLPLLLVLLVLASAVLPVQIVRAVIDISPVTYEHPDAVPKNCFWVGGSGTWSDAAAHWAAVSGGAPGAGNLPDADDDIFLDANSFTAGTQAISLDGNVTIGSISTAGIAHRIIIQSTVLGTARTLSIDGAIDLDGIDLMDITAAGAGSWDVSASLVGDCQGNTGITFTPAATLYWHADAGNWSDAGKWFLATNGGGGAGRVPLPQDSVIFDASSFDNTAQTVTLDMWRVGKNVNFSAVDNEPTFTKGGFSINFFGSWTFASAMTWTADNNGEQFRGRGNYTLTTAGQSLRKLLMRAPGGTLTLLDDAIINTVFDGNDWLEAGTLDANGFDVTANYVRSAVSTLARGLDLGEGTWLINDMSGNIKWNIASAGFTLASNNATVVLSNAAATNQGFTGGGVDYSGVNLKIQGMGDCTVTFNDSNTFQVFTVDASQAPKTIVNTGETQTVDDFTRDKGGTNVITLTDGTWAKSNSTDIGLDYLDVTGVTGNPANTWYVGSHSADGGGTAAIYFDDPTIPSVTTNAESGITMDKDGVTGGNFNGTIGDIDGTPYLTRGFDYGLTVPYSSATAPDSFNIVLIPDPQHEVDSNSAVWEAQMQWIKDNYVAQDIQAVIGLGDNTNDRSAAHYAEAVVGWDLVDDTGLPYIVPVGNHDYDTYVPRSTATFETYFPVSRFSGKSWYGGAYNSSTANYYIKFTVNGHNYLVMALEFYPQVATVAWAQGILTANPTYDVIITTHAYLLPNGFRSVDKSLYGPELYGLEADYSGEELWDNLIKSNSNIIAVVGGHFIQEGYSSSQNSLNDASNYVAELFCNFQNYALGGSGYMMILSVTPDTSEVRATIYSPVVPATYPSMYTLDYDDSRSATGSFTLPVPDNQTPGATYHYRGTATNNAGTVNGADETYVYTLPTLSTLTATNVGMDTKSRATLRGNTTSVGVASSQNIGFQWGYTPALGTSTITAVQTGMGSFTAVLDSFDPSKTVYYRAVAVVGGVVAGGSISSFKVTPTSGTGATAYLFLYPVVVFIWLAVCVALVWITAATLGGVAAVVLTAIIVMLSSVGVQAILAALQSLW